MRWSDFTQAARVAAIPLPQSRHGGAAGRSEGLQLRLPGGRQARSQLRGSSPAAQPGAIEILDRWRVDKFDRRLAAFLQCLQSVRQS